MPRNHLGVTIYEDLWEVRQKLAGFDLTVEEMATFAKINFTAAANTSALDPPIVPGFVGWFRTVRAIRESLLPKGWEVSDAGNFAITFSTKCKVGICVATGDEDTGRPDGFPKTKAPKGLYMGNALRRNAVIADLFPETLVPTTAGKLSECATWVYLVRRDKKVVMCELSHPASVDEFDRINRWRERIILPPVPIDSVVIDIRPEDMGPKIEVPVSRRA